MIAAATARPKESVLLPESLLALTASKIQASNWKRKHGNSTNQNCIGSRDYRLKQEQRTEVSHLEAQMVLVEDAGRAGSYFDVLATVISAYDGETESSSKNYQYNEENNR